MLNKYMCTNETDPLGQSCCRVGRDEASLTNSTANCSYTNDWINFTFNEVEAATNEMKACSNLSYVGNNRNFSMWIQIQLPDDLQSGAPAGMNSTAILNFTARLIT